MEKEIKNLNCKEYFYWLKDIFEKNDAGYQYIIDKKGKAAYNLHNEIFLKNINNNESLEECVDKLIDWLLFFRREHLSLRGDESKPNFLDIDIESFKKYIEEKEKVDYEGVWVIGGSKIEIGIKKINSKYIGFIIKTDDKNWQPKEIKLVIDSENDSAIYYSSNHYKSRSQIKKFNKDLFKIRFFYLIRKNAKFNSLTDNYIKRITATKPYFERIDDNILYLRIPSFNANSKKDIDKVILKNKELILKTKNLIIDLRDNGGGADSSYSELLPLIYTNPIRNINEEILSTKLNNENFINVLKRFDFPEEIKDKIIKMYNKLEEHTDQFINANDSDIEIITYPQVHKYPENVAIMINEGNGSTGEQFILNSKQSKKVKLYGRSTAGVLDISNMVADVVSPDKKMIFSYSISKSLRIPNMSIDGVGIQPDYYIDESIPYNEWLQFVVNNLKNF